MNLSRTASKLSLSGDQRKVVRTGIEETEEQLVVVQIVIRRCGLHLEGGHIVTALA